MAIPPIALSAYQNAMARTGAIDTKVSRSLSKAGTPAEGFGNMLTDSLKHVNELQNTKKTWCRH